MLAPKSPPSPRRQSDDSSGRENGSGPLPSRRCGRGSLLTSINGKIRRNTNVVKAKNAFCIGIVYTWCPISISQLKNVIRNTESQSPWGMLDGCLQNVNISNCDLINKKYNEYGIDIYMHSISIEDVDRDAST